MSGAKTFAITLFNNFGKLLSSSPPPSRPPPTRVETGLRVAGRGGKIKIEKNVLLPALKISSRYFFAGPIFDARFCGGWRGGKRKT